MKKLLSIGLLGLLTLSVQAIEQPKPENTVFMFDLDDVVLKKPGRISVLLQHKLLLVTRLKDAAYYLVGLRNNPMLKELRTLTKTTAGGDEYRQLFARHGDTQMKKLVEDFTLNKKPIEGTVFVMQQLNNQGFPLHVASNMSLNDLKYNTKKYPNIFNLFESQGIKVLDLKSTNPDKKAKKDDKNLAYFKDYQDTIIKPQSLESKTFVFIDDQKKNLIKAEEYFKKAGLNLITIHFKNPEQLAQELQKLGILVPTPMDPLPEPSEERSTEPFKLNLESMDTSVQIGQ